jgi:hypothetical protein
VLRHAPELNKLVRRELRPPNPCHKLAAGEVRAVPSGLSRALIGNSLEITSRAKTVSAKPRRFRSSLATIRLVILMLERFYFTIGGSL